MNTTDLKPLLLSWSALAPDECRVTYYIPETPCFNLVAYSAHIGLLAMFIHTEISKPFTLVQIQAAVQYCAEARGCIIELERDPFRPHEFKWLSRVECPGQKIRSPELIRATPAEALLTAYIEALGKERKD